VVGETMAPQRVKLMIALGLTLALTPAVLANPGMPPNFAMLASLVAGEIVLGLALGILGRLVMSAVNVAGTIVATQMGLAFATSVDPSQEGQGAVVGAFLNLTAIAMIFATDLHHLLIAAVRQSYDLFPSGGIPPTAEMAQWSAQLMSAAFATGVQIAAPFLVFGIVFNVAAGVVSRLMPQVQIFFLVAPLTILGGFVLLMFGLSAMMAVFLKFFETSLRPLAGG
ncbi:MAG TPA: flagellar biosynthetic protein FliR, partial [Alphaproteobacteria bacterium]|nr:flagellar biosynthetic protein FliR [Alphaproteobacteria bacterium]